MLKKSPWTAWLEHIFINRSYFCQLFKKEVGLTFGNYVEHIRHLKMPSVCWPHQPPHPECGGTNRIQQSGLLYQGLQRPPTSVRSSTGGFTSRNPIKKNCEKREPPQELKYPSGNPPATFPAKFVHFTAGGQGRERRKPSLSAVGINAMSENKTASRIGSELRRNETIERDFPKR